MMLGRVKAGLVALAAVVAQEPRRVSRSESGSKTMVWFARAAFCCNAGAVF